jgi:hypothetical protein
LVLSCGEEKSPYPEGWLSASSPYNTLSDWELCLNNYKVYPNILKLADYIIGEEFVFWFDPDDVGDVVGGYTIPAYWEKADFMQAINNMFNQAYSIDFKIPILEAGEDAFGKPADGDTTFLKSNVTISLTVMVDATSGYIAQGICDFGFAKDSDSLWRLSMWKDHTAQLVCTEPSSLGEILAMYYQ